MKAAASPISGPGPEFSLGYEEYRKAPEAEGMFLVGTASDEGKTTTTWRRRSKLA
jgi:hypothetical protein